MTNILTKEQWRRKRRKRKILFRIVVLSSILIAISFSSKNILNILQEGTSNNAGKDTITQTLSNNCVIMIKYLTPNPFSRPQTKLKRINGIVVHYTANPGTTAENNRSYFESMATKKTTSVSSHFIIGLEGEIIQCIPLTEISYASNDRNDDTISIECCHPDETGKFNEATYSSLVSLTAALCIEFDLDEKDIMRHYDITEKPCPLYYVEHEDSWEVFKDNVLNEVKSLSTTD